MINSTTVNTQAPVPNSNGHSTHGQKGSGGGGGGGVPALSSKQQQEWEKRQYEVHKHNTGVYNKIFDDKLEVDDLWEDQAGPEKHKVVYDSDKALDLYGTIRQLSRDKMSVYMIQRLLRIIFATEEVENLEDEEQ